MAESVEQQLRRTAAAFEERFGRKPTHAATAPGRVNLIGEHTDYNDGFVMPMAIDRQTVMVAAKREGKAARVASTDIAGVAEFEVSEKLGRGEPSWSNYVRGAVFGCVKRGVNPGGFDAVLSSTVPPGGGLSSSASIEVATATLCEALANAMIPPVEKALLAQKAEHDFALVPCGIMDQFISTMGQAGHALLIDCRTNGTELVPMNDETIAVLIINSNVKHELTGGEYAERRAQCEAAAKALGVKALRDATMSHLESKRGKLDDVACRRARHVIGENDRTLRAVDAMRARDWHTMGQLMRQSHESLRDDFEVSTPELDRLVELAYEHAKSGAVVGSRMTGGGFGGCTVTLARAEHVERVGSEIAAAYKRSIGSEATVFVTRASEGTRQLRV